MKAGIIGGAGYTAGELIRLLVNHPEVEIGFVHSTSNAGVSVSDVHEGLVGDTDLVFADSYDLAGVDVLFLCSGHGKSTEFWQANKRPDSLRVIDLAQDFRDESDGYVYGLPEINRDRIAGAMKVANPGCFATAIQLSLLPLVKKGWMQSVPSIVSVTGSTGAGVKPAATTHFSWRDNNLSVYKAFSHQHELEIGRTFSRIGGKEQPIDFVPVRGDFPRGIFITAWTRLPQDIDEVRDAYKEFYADATFTHVSDRPVDLKQAVNTNKAIIGLEKHGDRLLVTTAIDNLLKGASGQAVQNLNIMAGLPENTGLRLKPSAF